MTQQFTLLRKENDLLKSLIGQSFNQKSKFAAAKILDEIHSKAEGRFIGKKALCYITNKDEILGVGGSTLMKNKHGKIVSNLILNNFGEMMAGYMAGNPAVTIQSNLIDVGGTPRTILHFTPGNFNNLGNVGGILHRVGSGSTAPARGDIEIQTSFGTSPEDADFNSDDFIPAFDTPTGTIKSAGSIVAGAGGTVNELVLKGRWQIGASSFNFSLFRDSVSPGQSFVASDTITSEFTVQL